jgi:DNA-binding PadR family transcriptional regulator
MTTRLSICRVVGVSDRPKQRVLEAFLEDPAEPQYGYDLMKKAGVQSGTLYPLLANMERRGMVTVGWESRTDGRPPRKWYQLTGDGVAAARIELAALNKGHSAATVNRPATAGGGA